MNAATPDDILEFWLGSLDENGLASPEVSQRWWKKSARFDGEIRDRFEAEWTAVMAGERDAWLDTPRGRLAYIIVLDQLSRNMFRDQAKMYAGDARAQAAAKEGIDKGDDEKLEVDERVFFYMPLMHSEALADQERCCDLFRAFAASLEGPARKRVDNNHVYAVKHKDIVARWGRFPHRNDILERESTDEERAFLEEPGSSF